MSIKVKGDLNIGGSYFDFSTETNNYYGQTEQQSASYAKDGSVIQEAEIVRSNPYEKEKSYIEKLYQEGFFTDSKQWYAIYRVFSEYNILPSDKTAFCNTLDKMELSESIPSYTLDNWRKGPSDFPKLGVKVQMWENLRETSSNPQLKQIDVATQLMKLLDK